jgi:DNA-binding NarL/FixJ family response regulator
VTGRARLFIADDHHLLVQALRTLLESHFHIAGVALSGDELLRQLPAARADALLLDLQMPGRSGLDLLPELTRAWPQLRILIVTMYVDRVLADAALAAGAHGFVPKDSPVEELVVALNEVLAGRRYVSPAVPRVSNRVAMGAQHLGLARLTPRQQEIVKLIGAGRTTSEIADRLGLSAHTVSFHRKNIRRTLGIDTDWGLVRYAILVTVGSGEGDSGSLGGSGAGAGGGGSGGGGGGGGGGDTSDR